MLDIPSIDWDNLSDCTYEHICGGWVGGEGYTVDAGDLALVGYKFMHVMYEQRGHSVKLWKNYTLSW